MKTTIKCIIFIMISLNFYACNHNKSKLPVNQDNDQVISGQITISCDLRLQKILNIWISDFNITFPDIEVSLQETDPDFKLISENLLCEYPVENAWKIPVMREGIIPVISDKNPHLQILLEQGMNKETLKSVFTGQILSWGEVPGIDSREEIKVLLPEKGMGYNLKWANFIEVDADKLRGKRVSDKETLVTLFKNKPFLIGILNACCAYDPETNERVKGIIALPIDLNNNGRIDKKEELYNDLCSVERAVYLGTLPSELCNCIFLVSDKSTQKPEQIVFIKWLLTSGQKDVVKMGYSKIRQTTALEIIQNLESTTE